MTTPDAATTPATAVHAVHYTYSTDTERVTELRPAHRAFMADLLAEGVLLASGPWTGPEHVLDGAGSTGDDAPGALLLVRARDVAHCREILDADPFAAAGLITGRRVRGWDPVTGPWAG